MPDRDPHSILIHEAARLARLQYLPSEEDHLGWQREHERCSDAMVAAAVRIKDAADEMAARLAKVEADFGCYAALAGRRAVEIYQLTAELTEARLTLLAERGVGGAPSDGWRYAQMHRNDMGRWHRSGASVKKWGRGSASWLLTIGTAGTGHETAREAMQAADAALSSNGGDDGE